MASFALTNSLVLFSFVSSWPSPLFMAEEEEAGAAAAASAWSAPSGIVFGRGHPWSPDKDDVLPQHCAASQQCRQVGGLCFQVGLAITPINRSLWPFIMAAGGIRPPICALNRQKIRCSKTPVNSVGKEREGRGRGNVYFTASFGM